MNIGIFVDPANTPVDKIDFNKIKSDGHSEVYLRIHNADYNKFGSVLKRIQSAGIVAFAWTWSGFSYTKYLANQGWNIIADIEFYDMENHIAEIRQLRQDSKGKTLIICTKPTDIDGNQRWDLITPLVNAIAPMMYLGDYNLSTTQLSDYIKKWNAKYPNKIYPILETYQSDKNVVPKSNAVITSEIKACGNVKGIGLFRYGLSNFIGKKEVPPVTTTVDISKNPNVKILGPDFKLMIAGVKAYKGTPGFVIIRTNGIKTNNKINYKLYTDLKKVWDKEKLRTGKEPSDLTFNVVKTPVKSTPKPEPKPAPIVVNNPDKNGCYWSPRYLKDSNMKQDTGTWCALNAIQQAWKELFNIFVTEESLYKYGWTGPTGTGPNEFKKIVAKLAAATKVKVQIVTYSKKDISWDEIAKAAGDPKIAVVFHELYKDTWGHWDYNVGVCPINIYMANSLQGKLIGYSRATMESWFNGITSDNSIYFIKAV
ncbi:hypothetical protein [Methanobacterium spitsbergense]|uniref:Uncharacterized protein n=1 Tax=Methanobacterium spitsbergense TaxID=2874285 RepID=A0A8T5UR93_9EURY|nr:hypothetical protein [Methanobacterium spitsbergense]MBZ2166278.1 hypothetical protein [Methanobacterium spitsbergense]